MSCDKCGAELYVGDDVYRFDQTRISFASDLDFCSFNCLKAYARENLDDLLEELIEVSDVDDPDPYARYGVSREDF